MGRERRRKDESKREGEESIGKREKETNKRETEKERKKFVLELSISAVFLLRKKEIIIKNKPIWHIYSHK